MSDMIAGITIINTVLDSVHCHSTISPTDDLKKTSTPLHGADIFSQLFCPKKLSTNSTLHLDRSTAFMLIWKQSRDKLHRNSMSGPEACISV